MRVAEVAVETRVRGGGLHGWVGVGMLSSAVHEFRRGTLLLFWRLGGVSTVDDRPVYICDAQSVANRKNVCDCE